MGKRVDKFLLLLWKDWLLQYRKPIQTLVEILAPVCFCILLVIVRSLVDPESNDAVIYKPFSPIPLSLIFDENAAKLEIFKKFSLAYSPSNNTEIDDVMNMFRFFFVNVKSFENAKKLERHFVESNSNTTFAGIQFDDELHAKKEIPKNLKIVLRFPGELRSVVTKLLENVELKSSNDESVTEKISKIFDKKIWKTHLIYPMYQTPGPRAPKLSTGGQPSYYSEGFLGLQFLLTTAITYHKIRLLNITQLNQTFPLILMQRFPYNKWIEDPLLQALISFVGILIMLSFVYTCINTVKVITTEKEKQLKEAMKIMGLPSWLHWTAWFFKTFTFLFISIALMTVLLKIPWYPSTNYSIFTHTDPSVMLIFFSIYISTTIFFCFAVSVFFSKANTAATVAGLLWFLSYVPYLFLQAQYDQLSLLVKLMSCLGSNTAMAYGVQLMLMYEGVDEGSQWSNIWKPVTPDDSLSIGLIMLMLFFDSVLYLFITWYVEIIFPGDYGVPLPWYFPFTKSYWCNKAQIEDDEEFSEDVAPVNEFFELEPRNLVPGVEIKNLRKVFKKKAAVRNMRLNLYRDQITVLLGHNGAGKTTTMSMLTGMIPPTSGTAIICGHDIKTDMEGARANLGLCPQHNILFDDLTVREHLYFFGKLKGLSKNVIQDEIKIYAKLLDLTDKLKAKSSTLSGGMKRKLCVGIALCGNSKVVMLDEPTAGMDPSARRDLWDLLQKQKKGRSIFLTTHFMDEADLLGDRIAIMAGGVVQCCGSSFFLKKKYGDGYRLIMVRQPNCVPQKITELLQKYIPKIKINGEIGSELTYLLPENQSAIFEKMLHELESRSKELGISNYGISLTTLEDVFMKVGADKGQEEKYNNEIDSRIHQRKFCSGEIPPLLIDCELILNQFLAMLMKKLLSTLRAWFLQLIQNIIPVAFLIIAIVVSRNIHKTGDLPSLELTLDSYSNPITLIEKANYNSSYVDIYKNVIKPHIVEEVKNITTTMLDLTKNNPATARTRYIVGASFIQSEGLEVIKAWFNNNPFHSPGLALALVLDAFYKRNLGEDYSISFVNHPLPFTAETKVQQLLNGNSVGFQLAFNLAFSMAFVSSFYVLFYVKERVCKSKHLQFVSGVKVYIFWVTSFVCDLMTFMVTILSILITFTCFQEAGFRSVNQLGRIFLILFYFGVSMLPVMYFASYLFDIPATGYTRMTLFSVFTGVTAFLIIQILSTPGLNLKHISDALHWGFLVVPHYSLATGIRDYYTTFATSKLCNFLVDMCASSSRNYTKDDCWSYACHNSSNALAQFCCDKNQDYFKWESPGIGRNIFYSFATGITLFLLLLIVEYKLPAKIIHKINKTVRSRRMPKPVLHEDSDVFAEKQKIINTPEFYLINEYDFVMKNLTKYYGKFLAVNGLCVGIKKFECFGLLGLNGAGKTTTFKIITGDIKITYGDAWVNKYSIKTNIKSVQKYIGYCPQFDALLADLTAEETLIMFGLLRGIPLRHCKYLAEKLAEEFDFYRHLHKRVRQLSGGNKRKLSTAISMIGDPPVICLDEPTTGMDPAAKRNLWNALCRVRDSGKCIIFTSHSMEECEALCTRLAIMVNGYFQCLGSTQHLKNKFAKGYTLTIKIKKSGDSDIIERFIKENFPKAQQNEKHQELLSYYIVDESVPWSRMFGILERAKSELNIEDYSLGQSSLELVFLNLTKQQM